MEQGVSTTAPAGRVPAGIATVEDTVFIPVRLCNLPPFHPVAAKLMSLSAEAGADVKSVVSIVGSDPALAAEILFLANSSLFGFPARIQSLRHAAAVLGIDCIRQLATTVALRGLARGTDAFVHDCWRHSMACAVTADMIAPVCGASTDQAYSAGLLHDAGRLGFLRSYPSEIGGLLSAQYSDAAAVMAAEREAMNSSHTEAGAWLMEYWSLPLTFGETCAHHHDEFSPDDSALLRCVKIACRLANAMGFTQFRYTQQPAYNEILESLALHVAASMPAEETVRTQVETRLQAFD
jgi:HD-like signal output (HDOD) protein